MNPLRHLLLALQFFTRIALPERWAQWVGFSPALLRASAAYFPAIGALIGALTAAAFWLFMALLPAQSASPWVAAWLSTVLSMWLTGAFHEDGLADTADGLGGAVTRQRALEIMKDSRIGSYGSSALILALIGKIALLALIAQTQAQSSATAWLIFAAHVSSRWTPLVIIRTLHHAGDSEQSKSKPLADAISNRSLLIGTGWCLVALALVQWRCPNAPWLVAILGALIGLAYMRQLLNKRLQGFTGDGLGATQQVSELGFYLAFALAL